MLYIFIRTCKRDDYISRLAYESLKEIYPTAFYGFLAEDSKYKYLTDNIFIRKKCDNFGGQFGAKGLIKSLKDTNISPNNEDLIFIVDADIVMFKDVIKLLNKDTHHAGVMSTGRSGLSHISGQFQIISGYYFAFLVNLTIDEINSNINEMLLYEMDIADDTFLSFMSDKLRLNKQHVSTWIHHKFYEFNDNTDYKEVIKIIKERNLE